MGWRLLWASWPDPELNLAFEWALLELARDGRCPSTIRLWINPPCVIVDRLCRSLPEVKLDACARLGLPVLRRPTAGGAVYHDDGNLNWTLLARREDLPVDVRWPREAEALAGEAILALLSELGLEGRLEPGKGIFVGDCKVSGMAIYLGREAIMVHGTLLVSADLEALRAVLHCKFEVANLADLLGSAPGVREIGDKLAACLANALGIELPRPTAPDELLLATAESLRPRARLPELLRPCSSR